MLTFYRPEMISDAGSYSLSPLKPAVFVDRLRELDKIVGFGPATRDQIKLAHDPAYVDGVLDLKVQNGFGNGRKAVADSLPYTVGSMIAATKYVLTECRGRRVALSPTSGFHHAAYNHGGGFCTFNGLMVAAMVALKEKWAERIYIIDGDQHWGDGTQNIIDKLGLKKQVVQFSGDRTDAKSYLKEFEEACYEACRYDLVFYQAGADIHIKDPLGGILTTQDMQARDLQARFVAMQTAMVWNFAGGYQLDELGNTPAQKLKPVVDLHMQTYQEMLKGDGDCYDVDED